MCGAFSGDFTTILAPECRAFSGALKIEKLKAPLIPGPKGAVDTNDWCIIATRSRLWSEYKSLKSKYPDDKITIIIAFPAKLLWGGCNMTSSAIEHRL